MAFKKWLVGCLIVFLVGNSFLMGGGSPVGAQSKDRTLNDPAPYAEINGFRVSGFGSVDISLSFGASEIEVFQVNEDGDDEVFAGAFFGEYVEVEDIFFFSVDRGHSYYVIATNSEDEQFVSDTVDIPAENTVNENLLAPTIEGYELHPFRPDEVALLDITMNYSDDSSEEVLYIYQVNEETGEIKLDFTLTSPPSS
ncbi:hypothetical protein [Jeotgalibacillus marinus]|uniref:Uncharacterized protein n=1 Tax=Jeotgalibacillus marinus TaxID=86667 RepID=A0ABV3Q4S9_9BACL